MRIMSCVAPFRPGIALSFGPKWDTTQGKDERGWNEHEALRGIKTVNEGVIQSAMEYPVGMSMKP